MGSESWGRVGAIGVAALALVLLVALAGCGGGNSAAPAGGSASAHRPPPVTSGSPSPDGSAPSTGASGAPPPLSAAHDRFVRRADAACRAVVAQAAGSALDPTRRAHQLLGEQQGLQALEAALRPLRAPREDAAEVAAYRDALHAQAVLDGIVAHGLLAGGDGDDPGVEAGERQNDFNRAARTRIARRLGLSACFRDHA